MLPEIVVKKTIILLRILKNNIEFDDIKTKSSSSD
jgi:hypothetical protein